MIITFWSGNIRTGTEKVEFKNSSGQLFLYKIKKKYLFIFSQFDSQNLQLPIKNICMFTG